MSAPEALRGTPYPYRQNSLNLFRLILAALVADAAHFHIPRGYLYFAVAFSMMVEALNMSRRTRRKRS